jgi:hypothetical protein
VNAAAWHPDGRLILEMTRSGAAATIYAYSATGTNPVQLLPDGFRLTGTRAVSPDGTRLSVRDADGHLVSCVLATAACHRVPGSTEEDLAAGWHRDNRSLFVYQPVLLHKASRTRNVPGVEPAAGRVPGTGRGENCGDQRVLRL